MNAMTAEAPRTRSSSGVETPVCDSANLGVPFASAVKISVEATR